MKQWFKWWLKWSTREIIFIPPPKAEPIILPPNVQLSEVPIVFLVPQWHIPMRDSSDFLRILGVRNADKS